MNLKVKNWFLTQKILIILMIAIYITMSLTPWYYKLGVDELDNKGFLAITMDKINQSKVDDSGNDTEFERKYVNGGKLSAMDLIILTSYLISLCYVFGLFLSKTLTAVLVNLPVIGFLLIKTISIFKLKEIYSISPRNVIVWWVCLIIYYIAFYIHNNLVVTDIDHL